MFLLTLKEKRDEGAYAVEDQFGEKVLFLFEQEDDAVRYAMMMHDYNDSKKDTCNIDVIEVDAELAIRTCRVYNYKYAVITPNDFVIPPKNDNISED